MNLAGARQKVTVKQGIEQKLAKKIVATIKEAKLKVEAQINGDKLRVTGKKRDDLQDGDGAAEEGRLRNAAAVRQFPRLGRIPQLEPNKAARSLGPNRRQAPGARSPSPRPPIETRCSDSTWLPTAANIRRTW